MEAHDTIIICIPPEIIKEILSYLPVKLLLRLRSVCKEWKSIIGDPDFASLHLRHYPNNSLESHLTVVEKPAGYTIEEDTRDARARFFSRGAKAKYSHETSSVQPLVLEGFGFHGFGFHFNVAGDINGLVLIQKGWDALTKGDIFLWNPSIRKRFNIPLPPSLPPQYPDLFLGFDPSTNDYKVLACRHHETQQQSPTITLDIFSLKSRCWRRESRSGEICRLGTCERRKTSVGGFIHFVGYPDENSDDNSVDKPLFVSFDVTCETFSYTPLPDLDYEENRVVDVLGGFLVGLVMWSDYDSFSDIWVLGRDGCWSKRFKFPMHSWNFTLNMSGHQMHYVRKDGVLVWALDEISDRSYAVCAYDMTTGNKSILTKGYQWCTVHIGAYIDNLVLLD